LIADFLPTAAGAHRHDAAMQNNTPTNGTPSEHGTIPSSEVAPALLTLFLIRRLFVPLGERTLFRMISKGTFPPADIRIGGKVRFWRRETVEAWISTNANFTKAGGL
jgi:predicted DNA-binding transcriptional regulator AlpA